jgi:hypothetical protein
MEMHTGFWSGNLKERGHTEDLGLDGTIILKWVFKKIEWEGVYWINLAEDWDKRWAGLNTVMMLQVT